MNIISGYSGVPHVSSQQWRDENIALYGVGTYILNVGSKLAATVVSANEITIADGLVIAQGCTAEVERGTTESIAVDNGEQGMLRKDLVVLRYTRNATTNVEDMELDIIKGTPATSNPATPSYTSGSIADGDTLVEFPIYTVNLNGITIQSVTRLVDYVTIPTKAYVDGINTVLTNLINTTKTQLQNSINTLSSTLTTVSNRVGTATLNTTAKNALAAINELLTKINTTNTNLSTTNTNLNTQKGRIDTLVSKTSGLVSFDTSNVAANSNGYRQLTALGMYLVLVNSATTSNAARGMALVGVASNNALGIKVISTANNVALSDAGNGLLKIANTSSITVRLTIIRVY